jgi:hypothetical protein
MPKPVNPAIILEEGASLLQPVLGPGGFAFHPKSAALGSGGRFASGRFVASDREVELHFRYSLGLVTYRLGEFELDHVTYMRYLGCYGRNQYPGFSEDPLDGFRHLALDLAHFCQDFVTGSGASFCSFAAEHATNPGRFSGIRATR